MIGNNETALTILLDLVKAYEETPKEMALKAIEILKGFGIEKLALWSEDFLEYEQVVDYNEEDRKLFGDLRPGFWPSLTQGGDDNQVDGRVVAVALNNRRANPLDKLQLICNDDWNNQVFSLNASDAMDLIETRIEFAEVMKAVVLSIRFNLEHNIPIEKWGICHHPYVNPYSYEYVGAK